MNALTFFAGIDWGSEPHQVCLLDASGTVPKERSFSPGGAGLHRWRTGCWPLRRPNRTPSGWPSRFRTDRGSSPGWNAVGSCMRSTRSHGTASGTVGSPAGAQDDRREARVRAGALRTDGSAVRLLDPISPAVLRLREGSRRACERTAPRTRLVHRIRPQLGRYDPQFLDRENDLSRAWFRELWDLAPTPDRARRLRARTVTRILRRPRVRRRDADPVRKTLRAPAIRGAEGTTEAAVGPLRVGFAPLDLVTGPRADVRKEIDRQTTDVMQQEEGSESASGQAVQRDAEIRSSRPGVGRIVRATLLAEAPEALRRRDDPALRCRSGVAPVPRRSGTSVIVVRRRAAHHRLQEAVDPWARVAMPQDPARRAQYPALRLRGHRPARAVRSVADRRLAGVCALQETQTRYDPALRSRAEPQTS